MRFSPDRMDAQESNFVKTQWTDIYGDVKEEIPTDFFVDAVGRMVLITMLDNLAARLGVLSYSNACYVTSDTILML
jgi:hypothetical protein